MRETIELVATEAKIYVDGNIEKDLHPRFGRLILDIITNDKIYSFEFLIHGLRWKIKKLKARQFTVFGCTYTGHVYMDPELEEIHVENYRNKNYQITINETVFASAIEELSRLAVQMEELYPSNE